MDGLVVAVEAGNQLWWFLPRIFFYAAVFRLQASAQEKSNNENVTCEFGHLESL